MDGWYEFSWKKFFLPVISDASKTDAGYNYHLKYNIDS